MDRVEREIARVPYNCVRTHPGPQFDSDSDSAITSDDDEISATECRLLDDGNHRDHDATPTRNQLGKPTTRILSPRTVKALETVLLVVALGVVLGLFTLPIIFYFKSTEPYQYTTKSNESTFNCTPSYWVADSSSSQCTGEPYQGGPCNDSLLEWQQCITGQTKSALRVAVSWSDQGKWNNKINHTMVSLDTWQLSQHFSPECKDVAVLITCLNVFPLCDDESGLKYLPSQELCESVNTGACEREWDLATSLANNVLPNCSNLPDAPSAINCSDGFFLNGSTCVPSCYEFSTVYRNMLKDIVMSAAIFGLCTSSLLFLAFFMRRKIILRFPYVFLLYINADYCILVVLVLISLFDRRLLCSTKNVLDSIMNPTLFCKINGASLQYFLINMCFFWFLHIGSVFCKVMFPHLAQKMERKQGLIHAALVILAMVLPLPAPILAIVVEKYRYTIPGLPAFGCLSQDPGFIFYSMILVLDILLASTVCLCIITLWVVHKHRQMVLRFGAKSRREMTKIGNIEHRILVTLTFFAILGVMSQVFLATAATSRGNFLNATQEYTSCASLMQGQGSCDQFVDGMDQYQYHILGDVTYATIGLLPSIILIFIIDWTSVGKFATKIFVLRWRNSIRRHDNHTSGVFSTFSPVPITSTSNW